MSRPPDAIFQSLGLESLKSRSWSRLGTLLVSENGHVSSVFLIFLMKPFQHPNMPKAIQNAQKF